MLAVGDIAWIFSNAWLFPAIPATAFLLILFFGKRLPYKGAEIGITSVLSIFVLACLAAGTWIAQITEETSTEASSEIEEASFTGEGGATESLLFVEGDTTITQIEGEEGVRGAPIITEVEWFSFGETAEADTPDVGIGTWIDGQSVMMLFVVTLISGLVHVYSTDYVGGDRRYTHYFAFLSLFTASMLFMVLSTSTIQLLVGWELVGVCSFGLIGHWWEEKPNSDAALKAFLTNRVGDVGLIIGIIILFFAAGNTFSITEINTQAVLSCLLYTSDAADE